MHISIFHPTIFKALEDLKGLYVEIISGRGYAIFNPTIKDFEKSNAADGDTGYSFFLKHFKDIQFEKRPSPKREFNIALVNKYRNNAMYSKLLVMPAGLRDYTLDENNKPSEDEINTMYRRVLSTASIVQNVNKNKENEDYLDSARYNLQQRVNEIYFYLVGMLEGKSKFFQGRWASRKVFDTTRNVITPYVAQTDEFFTPKSVSTNQTTVGIYQYCRSIMPLAVKHVRDTYLTSVFVGPNAPAMLVNRKTLKKEMVNLDSQHYDDWMTYEGLEKFMSRFGQQDIRDDVLEIEGYYLGLLYRDDKHVRFIQDIDDVPPEFDKKKVSPITYGELLYLSLFSDASTIPALVTRYPVTGYGSVYPSYIYLKSTVRAESLKMLGDDWQETGEVCFEFPISGEPYYNSMSPSAAHLARLGADHDGDLCSLICLITEESKEEVRKKLNSRDYYVGVNGKMAFSAADDVINLVLANMTK